MLRLIVATLLGMVVGAAIGLGVLWLIPGENLLLGVLLGFVLGIFSVPTAYGLVLRAWPEA